MRMPNRLQHRQVCHRVAVGKAAGQAVTALGGKLAHLGGFCLSVGIELDLAGIPAVGYRHPGRDDAGRPEQRTDRPDHLLPGSTHDDHVPARFLMRGKQPVCLRVNQRDDDLVEVLPDYLPDAVGGPAAAQITHLSPDLLHPAVAGTPEPEHDLGAGAPECLGPADKSVPVKRGRERQRARARDDRLVEIEESGLSSATPLDGGAHDPAA